MLKGLLVNRLSRTTYLWLGVIALLLLPWIVGAGGGNYWVRVLDFALLYIVLALGLNVVVGFAGLLDLGYIDTFIDRPATVLMGSGQFAPCFENVLLGLAVGEKKSALLAPEESFGERKEDLVQWVSLKALKEGRDDDTEFNPGDVIEFNAPGGAQYAGVLQSINDEGAWFDFNHPLAGRSVTFEAEIVAIL